MTRSIPLSSGIGEILAPQTLLSAFICSPDGTVSVDPGALHGRSQIERTVQFVQRRDQVLNPQIYWLVWVAIELDASNQPVRYKGVAASEMWVDAINRVAYKVLAEHVNRMAEALRGGIHLETLDAKEKALIAQQLVSLGPEVWERSAQTLKDALT